MNREMRRLQAKEEERARKRRRERPRPQPRGERTNPRQFLREVRQELKKVAWPSRQELLTYTAVTFLVTTAVTLYVFALDWAFKIAIFDWLGDVATS